MFTLQATLFAAWFAANSYHELQSNEGVYVYT